MSKEDAKKFIEKLKTDEKFRAGYEKSADKAAYAKNAGFEFTADEIKEVKSQLADEDLAEVAGGGGFGCNTATCDGALDKCDTYLSHNCGID